MTRTPIRQWFGGSPPWLLYWGLIALLAAPAPPPALPQFAAAPPLPAAPARSPQRAAFSVKTVLTLDAKLELGDFAWSDEGAPPGPIEIVADLAWQRLYVYQGGVEIGRSSIIYGANDKPTPMGAFAITGKDAHHVSNLYDAKMPYMMRLTNDGITIHGTEHVAYGYASNGCVGIPTEFARLLFAKARVGDKVLITNNWMRQVYRFS